MALQLQSKVHESSNLNCDLMLAWTCLQSDIVMMKFETLANWILEQVSGILAIGESWNQIHLNTNYT